MCSLTGLNGSRSPAWGSSRARPVGHTRAPLGDRRAQPPPSSPTAAQRSAADPNENLCGNATPHSCTLPMREVTRLIGSPTSSPRDNRRTGPRTSDFATSLSVQRVALSFRLDLESANVIDERETSHMRMTRQWLDGAAYSDRGPLPSLQFSIEGISAITLVSRRGADSNDRV